MALCMAAAEEGTSLAQLASLHTWSQLPWPVLPLSLISAWCDALSPPCVRHISAAQLGARALDAVLHTMAWAIIQGDALCNDRQALSVLM